MRLVVSDRYELLRAWAVVAVVATMFTAVQTALGVHERARPAWPELMGGIGTEVLRSEIGPRERWAVVIDGVDPCVGGVPPGVGAAYLQLRFELAPAVPTCEGDADVEITVRGRQVVGWRRP